MRITLVELIIGLFILLFVGAVAKACYDQSTCLEWREVPGQMTCTNYGTISHCEPARECVRR